MEPIKKDNERLVNEDVIYKTWYTDEVTKEKIINPTDFRIRFFVPPYTREVICSRSGAGAPINCEISSEGDIFCFLPENTFLPGRLHMEDIDVVDCSGFADGNYKTIEVYPTKLTYIDLET